LPARLLAQVLPDRVVEVDAADARALVRGIDEVGEEQQVLEPVGVLTLDVAAPRAVEASIETWIISLPMSSSNPR